MNRDALAKYIADPTRRKTLSEAVGASPLWLYQVSICWRGKRASKALALSIERATEGAVSKSDLRPDIWPPEPTQQPATQKVA